MGQKLKVNVALIDNFFFMSLFYASPNFTCRMGVET